MSWRDAIIHVLEDEGGPVHYADIAQAISDRGYRTSVGATPANSVATTISTSMQDSVVRTDRGYYALALDGIKRVDSATGQAPTAPPDVAPTSEDAAPMGLINAFGMFWQRSEVFWPSKSVRLLGIQQSGSERIDFAEQAGVYLLYDGERVIYVGRVSEPRLGQRLWEHTRDRLTGRWNRFSWFGVRGVSENGKLGPIPSSSIEVPRLIATLEALLIEGLEPPQNRRQGDGFNALEFIQMTDPDVALKRKQSLLAELGQGLC